MDSTVPSFSSKARLLRRMLCIVAVLTPLILSFAPDGFLLMLVRSFALYVILAFGVLALLTAIYRHWRTALVCGVSALALLPQLASPQEGRAYAQGGAVLRIAHLNLLQPNKDHAEVIARIVQTRADIISLQEVGADWASVLLRELPATYPYHRVVPREDCYGIALFSKVPFEEIEQVDLYGKPAIRAVVRAGEERLQVFSVHARSPQLPSEYAERNAQLERVAVYAKGSIMRSVIVGDLNAVSWDPAIADLCSVGDLSLQGDPYDATFPSVLGMALIPIDHVLVSPGVTAVVGRSFFIPGSDHRGLIADIHLCS